MPRRPPRNIGKLSTRPTRLLRPPATGRITACLLASSLDATGDWPSAKKAELEAGLVLDPNNAQLLNYLGYSLLERNEEVAAASAHDQARLPNRA